ncbi:methyltransferase, FxLD system [Streptacidiphilus sp. EB103A]|uniref:methyltransferase, FxLD system n=1 Tax=Streptacidiphilus sp. EB103A TaxID=3156275 RepID=UPI0035194EA2
MDSVVAASASDLHLRSQMVDVLQRHKVLRTPGFVEAMRRTPRHPFVPEATAEQAHDPYHAVRLKSDAQGNTVSSASAPVVVAAMLEQLEVRPGDQVLEVGSVGYNAAVVAELVGSSGQVTTVEIDREIADRARRLLEAAGFGHVLVRCGDGRAGAPDRAPFDRIVITAGAFDIAEEWLAQLAPGGRLVVPLRLPWPMSVALERSGDHWVSRSVETCGFVPVTGPGARPVRRVSSSDGAVTLVLEDERAVDPGILDQALAVPREVVWTGVVVDDGPGWEDLHLRLMADSAVPGFTKINVTAGAAAKTLQPLLGWGGPGFQRGADLGYLANRRGLGGDGEPYEIAVVSHGPSGLGFAEEVASRIRFWSAELRDRGRHRIEVYRAQGPASHVPGRVIAERSGHRITVVWSEH